VDLSRFVPLISIFLSLFLAGCGAKEPVKAYGKPVADWLAELKKPDSRARKKAVTALGQIGSADPAAIPALIGALRDEDAAVKEKAIMALQHLGPAAKEAIPALTEIQSDPAFQAQAIRALEKIRGP
jgi:HEAT repeat protein